MLGEHHTLGLEFPEKREQIHELKISDNHFHRLMEEYDDLTKKVERLEQEGEPLTDESMTDLKKRRLELKDELYAYLK